MVRTRSRTGNGLTERQSARIERIIAATNQLLAEKGPDEMTMRDIAAASGVAEGTLYNRFGTKDHLLSVATVAYFEDNVSRNVAAAAGKTAVEKVLVMADVVARAPLLSRAFTRGLMKAWFNPDGSETVLRLAQTIEASWMPVLIEMRAQAALQSWVSCELLAEELCEREFGVVVKWAQGRIADRALRDRLAYASLVPLLGASRGAQAREIEALLGPLAKKLAKVAAGRRG